MKKLLVVVGLSTILVATLILGGLSTAAPTPKEKWPSAISIGTGPSGSGAYTRSAGLAVMMEKYLGVTTVPEAIGAANAQLAALAELANTFSIRVLLPFLVRVEEFDYWFNKIRLHLPADVPIGAMAETTAMVLHSAVRTPDNKRTTMS